MILKSDRAAAQVSLNGEPLPGILQSLSVNGEVLVDSSNEAGSGKAVIVSRGLKDKTVGMGFLIVGDKVEDAYDKLKKLETLFRAANMGVPIVYTIDNEHLQSRNIEKMLFQSFSSSESGAEDTIQAHLSFVEFTKAPSDEKSPKGGGKL